MTSPPTSFNRHPRASAITRLRVAVAWSGLWNKKSSANFLQTGYVRSLHAGIGVGCGACALCAIAGGALCLWRRAKAKRTPQRYVYFLFYIDRVQICLPFVHDLYRSFRSRSVSTASPRYGGKTPSIFSPKSIEKTQTLIEIPKRIGFRTLWSVVELPLTNIPTCQN